MQTLIDFKTNHPILFWVFLPLVIVAAIFLFLTGSKTDDIVRPVEKQDADLQVQAQHIKDQAEEQVHIAEKIQEKIDNVNVETIPLDWHKRSK